MTVSVGFTAAEIRAFVHEYQVQPHGQKASWLAGQGVSYDRLRRWRTAVFEGDLDRRLVPREGEPMTVPPGKRADHRGHHTRARGDRPRRASPQATRTYGTERGCRESRRPRSSPRSSPRAPQRAAGSVGVIRR